MDIDFDFHKETTNLIKHGLSLSLAAHLDWDVALVWIDGRFEYGECRMIALAPETGILYYVAFVDRGPVRLAGRRAGQGQPLLLMHGHPQTMAMWHRVAPQLAQRFSVVMMDLRGYGDSSRPEAGPDNVAYSRREMALDAVAQGAADAVFAQAVAVVRCTVEGVAPAQAGRV